MKILKNANAAKMVKKPSTNHACVSIALRFELAKKSEINIIANKAKMPPKAVITRIQSVNLYKIVIQKKNTSEAECSYLLFCNVHSVIS